MCTLTYINNSQQEPRAACRLPGVLVVFLFGVLIGIVLDLYGLKVLF